MKLGLNLGYSGASPSDLMPLVAHADRIGLDSVWVGEAYGADAVSVLGYLAAGTQRIGLGAGILQMPARTPTNTAMTAMTLDLLSGGRVRLGLGLSGPQVVEGWHGVPYGSPIARTREYLDIVRAVIHRDAPLEYEGSVYQIPYTAADATGLGKPLRSSLHPLRREVPIYLAAIGPRNVALAAEIADGWLPVLYSPEHDDAFGDALAEGFAAGGRSPDALHVAASVMVAVGDDVAMCRDQLRPFLALYIGGMGARQRNFYADLIRRYGYEETADTVQDRYLGGHKTEAATAIPDALVDELTLAGPLDRVVDRLEAWKASRVDTLIVGTNDPNVLEALQGAL